MKISISYKYNRGGECKTSAGRRGPLPAHMSHHHIIAYPRMYFLGVLSLVYLKKQNNMQQVRFLERVAKIDNNAISSCLKSVEKNKSLWSVPTHDNAVNESLYRIAWMPMNLFIGPSAKFRLDDPHQENDEIPISMRENRRKNIERIEDGLRKYVTQKIPLDSETSKCITFNEEKHFDELMKIFFGNINDSFDCYDSKVSDWYIEVINNCNSSKGRADKYYISKNASLPEENTNNQTKLSAKFGLIGKENKKVLVPGKRFGILSKGDTSVNGVIKSEDGTYDTELNRNIRDVLRDLL